MIEFTGERVVPGQVDLDLWCEHVARYAFARRYASGKSVLDAGSGTGYGSAELAQAAALVTGLDFAPEAGQYAHQTFPLPNLQFAAGACENLPFEDASFDLVVAFEVIEHIRNYREFLSETARVLRPDGLFIVSTPNKRYYAESRADTGPNPYHQHEFEAEELFAELNAVFPNVGFLVQNWVGSIAFHPVKIFWPSDARIDAGGGSAADAHFFLAICSRAALPPMRSFVYVPKASNVLREREQHVQLLETDLAGHKRELAKLLELFRKQQQELEEHNLWAAQLNRELTEARGRIAQLQDELQREQALGLDVARGYQEKVRQLELENEAKTNWARETEQRLEAALALKVAELGECAGLLDKAEATVVERTLWAQSAEAKWHELEAQLNEVRASRWIRLGNRVGLGPVIEER